ncbi:MAG: hypothetical protein NWE93_04220 [Candidatus Bathyarchaeota archaeon]|nr:hypothetical protein [Candidatus Bathyarchaeota archaeon]
MINLTRLSEHKHDDLIVLLCFLGGALAGFVFMHHTAIFGI